MGGCFFNYLIKVTPHCVVLCLNRPFLSDERPVCMFPRSPLLRQRPNPPPPPPPPSLYDVCPAKCLGTVSPSPLRT